MKKEKKKKIKLSSSNRTILIILSILVIISLLTAGILKLMSDKEDNNSTGTGLSIEEFYSSENCRCLERNDFRCSNSSWQLDIENRRCTNGKTFTNVIAGCSQYECLGIIYQLNAETKKWEAK